MPVSSWRMPGGGSCVTSTSAMRLLRVASQPGELDAGRLAERAAAAVRPDEVLRPQRRSVTEHDIDAALVLGEAGHVAATLDPNPELLDPVGEDRLDAVLPQSQPVWDAASESR